MCLFSLDQVEVETVYAMLKMGKNSKDRSKLMGLIAEMEAKQPTAASRFEAPVKKTPEKKSVEKKLIRHQKEVTSYQKGIKHSLDQGFSLSQKPKRTLIY